MTLQRLAVPAGVLSANDPRHGTTNGYNNIKCRCAACRSAHNAYCASSRAKKTDQRALEQPSRYTQRRFSIPPTPLATPCRIWQGVVKKDGYGLIHRPEIKDYQRLHRWVMEQVVGPIPPGLVVMHLCDNRPCFRFDHLRIGTLEDNNADRDQKGRRAGPRGVRNKRSKLTDVEVHAIRAALNVPGRVGVGVLAKQFGVSDSTIRSIGRRLTWAHLSDQITGQEAAT